MDLFDDPRALAARQLAERAAAAICAGDGPAIAAARAHLHEWDLTPPPAALTVCDVRARLQPCPADELAPTSGIYLITCDPLLSAAPAAATSGPSPASYVGLAKDLHSRFHNPTFGHLSAGNHTRSQTVLTSPGAFIAVLDEVEPALGEQLCGGELSLHLATREIFWWLVLRQCGLPVVNAVSALGATSDHEGVAVAVTRVRDGRVRVYARQADAFRSLRVKHGPAAAALCGFQSQSEGYAFRVATIQERQLVSAGWSSPQTLGSPGAWWDGGQLRWDSGCIGETDLAQLRARKRPARYRKDAASGFRGVTTGHRHPGLWTAYVVTDPARRSHWSAVGRRFASDVEAAQAREAHLDAHPELAAINTRNVLPAAQ